MLSQRDGDVERASPTRVLTARRGCARFTRREKGETMDEERVDAGQESEVGMEVVFTANGEMEALTVRSALEAAGIPAELRIEAAAKLLPVTVDGLGAVRVAVPADRADEARAILETPASVVGETTASGDTEPEE
jgi:hypothetical protein